MKKVIVLSGVSGVGKSTYAKKLCDESSHYTTCTIVSADDFFTTTYMNGEKEVSEYNFDPSKLSLAHGECFRAFINALLSCPGLSGLVVVDNTNTTSEEIAPYILGAQAYGWDVEIVTLYPAHTTIDECYARNVHGVGFAAVEAQGSRIVGRKLMPWWKSTIVEM